MKDEYLNHKDFIESLKNPSLDIYHKVYHKNKKGRGGHVKKPTGERMTLAKLAQEMRDGFKRIDNRIDNLEKDINTRLDRVENRLDYIVKSNNLKDSK